MLTLSLVLTLAAAPIGDDPAFQKALASYEDLEFEQAILQLQSLAIRTDLASEDKATILVWLGVTYGQTGNLDAARQHFELAAAASSDVALPVRVSPELDKAFQAARAAAAERAAAQVAPTLDDKAPPAPRPTAAPPEPAPEAASLAGVYWTVAGVGLAGGVIAAGAGVGLGVWSFLSISEAADPTVPQKRAAELVDTANFALTAAVITGVVGVALLGAGGAGAGLALAE